MASKKSIIARNVQDLLEKYDWQAAIAEMEKLFEIDQDPHIRVRIGDVRRKLSRPGDAIKDYVKAAELFAERGFVVKALAQLNLVLRLDSSNEYARLRMEMLRTRRIFTNLKREPTEYRVPEQLRCDSSVSSTDMIP
jgi:tetratricopeptide (TPR) repeat protein